MKAVQPEAFQSRIPVATAVGLMANGLSADEITAEYPQLTSGAVKAANR